MKIHVMIPKQNRLSIVAKVIESAKADSITGNFETLGSKFSNETEGLLASLATIKQSLSHLRNLINTRPKKLTFRSSNNPISHTGL